MSFPQSIGVVYPPSRLNSSTSTRSDRVCPYFPGASAILESRHVNCSVLSELPAVYCRFRIASQCQCSGRLEVARLPQELQCNYEVRDRSSRNICKRRTHDSQYKRKQNTPSGGIRVACIVKRSQLFCYDTVLPKGRNDYFAAGMESLRRHDKLSSRTDSNTCQISIIGRCHCLANHLGTRLRYPSATRLAIGYFIPGAVLGSRSSVAASVNKRTAVEGRDHVGETSSVTRQDNSGFQEANLSIKSDLKIEGFEESKASPGVISRAELHLSSYDVGSKRGFNLQLIGKIEDICHWWKALHEVYRDDTMAWGFGTNPIFTVYEGQGGRIERVVVDEKEIQRRVGVEPFFSSYSDEASKALVQQRIAIARGIAKDIKMGITQPKNYSTIFSVVKPMNKQDNQHMYRKVFNHIDSFAHTAAPVLRPAILVGVTIYGFCVLWGVCISLSKRQQKNMIKDEESAARFDRISKMRALIDKPDKNKGQGIKASISADTSDFVQKLEEVREMAMQLSSGGDGSQTSVESDGRQDFITVGENPLESMPVKLSPEDGAGNNVVDIEREPCVYVGKSNMEEMNDDYSCGKVDDKDTRKVQASALEDGSNILQGNLKSTSAVAEKQTIVGNDAFQTLGPIEKGNISRGPLKPSLRVKPRIIMSLEEAKITITSRRARATSTNSIGSQNEQTRKTMQRTKNGQMVNSNVLNPRAQHSLAEDSSANDNVNEERGLNTRVNGSSSSVQSGHFNVADLMQGNEDQTLDLQNEGQNQSGKWISNISVTEDEVAKTRVEEEPAWMRNKALREVVFEVKRNEEAGREPFFGLGSDEQKLFLEGITERIKMEQDRVAKLVEGYVYGGIEINDSPCSKDTEKAGRSPLSNELLVENKKELRDQQSFKPSLLSSTVKVSDGVQDMELTETQENSDTNKHASCHIDPAVVGSGRPLRKKETFKNSKRWGKELQKKFDSEKDPKIRELMKEIGADLDSWVTEEEVEEAGRLALKLEQGEEEYVQQHFKNVHEKIKQQKKRFGLEAVLNKYKEYQPEPEDDLWWLDLHCVLCVKVISKAEREGGLYSLDMSLDFEGAGNKQAKHVIGFEDRKDVMSFCYLLEGGSEPKFANVEVCPFSPKQLYKVAKSEGFKVTVLKQGQLRVNVGQSLDEVEEKILEIGRNISLERLEKEQSIDVDSILDQGFGL